ncbi:MAG TPA: Asp-tRNA(Asn)/Glu-tRNA(Gln) amidotransferase subunit GatA [Candidatus Saccharimonadales bacterium]|nr:Asp-tRNA(Asn)/Glu-tRNA(Gln) amidotransferase subunit GatA [Candidatus Saccharimonadales bacterium]
MVEWEPIATLAAKVNNGEVKAADLVERSLKAIADSADYDAIIATTEERARARAAAIDAKVAAGENAGRLAGVPFIAKDNFLAFGAETTAASNILKGFVAPYQATAIQRLEGEGAILVAKANLDAFAHGGSTENSDFMVTKNPHDKTRVPGGSSGGSAAAVVLGLAPFALGTDTGGSIRQPASFSGCVGYKPTYGLVSRSGVVAMASSTDVIGPLTMSVADAALVLDVMADRDPLDSTTIERDPAGYTTGETPDLRGKKIGVIKEYLAEGLKTGVMETVDAAALTLKAAGAEIVEVSLPTLPVALAVYYILCPAEVSSNLARYDGQRYGYSDPSATTLEESYLLSRGKGFGREAKRRIMVGTYVLSSGYYDAYYRKAQVVRTKLIKEFEAAFQQVDYLLGPSAPSTAFKLGENVDDPLMMYLSDVMTVAANLTGIPAISLPCGESDGLPVGLQLMAPQRRDRDLLALAKATEEVLA